MNVECSVYFVVYDFNIHFFAKKCTKTYIQLINLIVSLLTEVTIQ